MMPVFDCEQDFLTNLVAISPKNARREFRYYIFDSWDWECAYCGEHLTIDTATLDHIIPKFKGGHSVKSNLCCCCSHCNREKGSDGLNSWYNRSNSRYCEERFDKLMVWIEQSSYSIKFSAANHELIPAG